MVMSALVIGCMVPDFEFFLRLSPRGAFGHTLAGVFVLDLPLALIALWLYHSYAKEPLYAWLPESVRRRIQLGPASWPIKNAAQFAMVLLSIVIGAATHILWDSFTHEGFWPYRHWQFLQQTVALPVYGQMEYLRVIQHASTVIGGLVLLLWLRNWYRTTAPTHPDTARDSGKNQRATFFVVCIVALASGALRGFTILEFGTTPPVNIDKFAFECAVITAIDAFWLGVVVYGVLRTRVRKESQDA
jgi:membrane-bound metal-dependent hydrolase YbcI (DUF457 family)